MWSVTLHSHVIFHCVWGRLYIPMILWCYKCLFVCEDNLGWYKDGYGMDPLNQCYSNRCGVDTHKSALPLEQNLLAY